MPFIVRKIGSKFVVISEGSGRIIGTHDSREKAEAQRRLLEMKLRTGEIK